MCHFHWLLCSSPEVKWNEPFLWLYGALYIGLVFKNVLNWFVHSQPDSTSMTIMVVRKTGGDDQRELYCTAIYVQNDLLHIFRDWLYDLVMIRKMFKNVKILLWWSKQSKCNHCLLSIPFYFYLKECANNLFFQEFLPSLITENLENTRIIG